MKLSQLIAIIVLFALSGCTTTYRFPDEALASRASLDFAKLQAMSADLGGEEASESTRHIALEAIRADMLAVGKHPQKAIDSSELMSLVSLPPSHATGASRVNYRARVRINYARHWVEDYYLLSERAGNIIVRKISF